MVPKRPEILLAVVVALALPTLAVGADFYVAPTGSPSGDGSFGNPWDLQTALYQPSSVQPGDTIWLRGGTYVGPFGSNLFGTPAAPINVRQYPGERATLDGNYGGYFSAMYVYGSDTWFWGFEIFNSSGARTNPDPGENPPSALGMGMEIFGPGTKVINMVIHDTAGGIGSWSPATDSEVYGSLIYYNGWEGPDRGHGHGIYTQNQAPSVKQITDNIFFSGFSHGVHAYGSSNAYLDNFDVEGNTIFNAGNLSANGGRNLLLGGEIVANNPIVSGNFIYRSPGPSPISDSDLGYGAGCSNATITGNYVSNNAYFVNCLPVTMTGNIAYGSIAGVSLAQYPNNTYYPSPPSGVEVFIRPNAYEAGRANITIYNWDLVPTVSVDLSAILPVGSIYEIRNAQDFFAPPVLSGTYDGNPVSIPMTGLSVATPVGWTAPPPTGPEFNAFVLITTLMP
jgi:hypothetical protein